jgi:uncharacterized protein YxeA
MIMKKVILTLAIVLTITGSAFAMPYMAADGFIDIIMKGKDYSDISALGTGTTPVSGGNEWYIDGDAIKTFWQEQWVEYTTRHLDAGNWNIGLNVINHGDLGTDGTFYSEFQILNSVTNQIIAIPASDTEVNHGFINVDLTAGIYTMRYTWLNDKNTPQLGLDANIQINDVFFEKVSPVVPEPATMTLLGLSSIGLLALRKRK